MVCMTLTGPLQILEFKVEILKALKSLEQRL